MIKRFFLIFIFQFLLNSYLIAQAYQKDIFEKTLSLGLPVVVINTENEEEPSCDYVSAPEGSWGKSIINAEKIPGEVSVFDSDGSLLYYSGEYKKGDSGMTIKVRGNTSAYYNKKPFKIKLQKKGDLLGRNDKSFNDKNWVLLNDPNLNMYVGLELSKMMDMDWTPEAKYVNVIINNDYRGLYLLAESVERNEECRVNVSNTGFIVEHDAYWWNEEGQYLLSSFNPFLNYTFKYPDFEDLSEEDINKIQYILDTYEQGIEKENYTELIDIESFAKWILSHDILGTWDGGGSNFYLCKYDINDNSLIKAGPLWDFESMEIMDNDWSGPHTVLNRFKGLYTNDSSFMHSFLKLWNDKKISLKDGLSKLFEELKDTELWKPYASSLASSNSRWNTSYNSPDVEADKRKDWFMDRLSWIDGKMNEIEASMGIENIESENVGASDIKIIKNGFISNISGYRILIYKSDGSLYESIISEKGKVVKINNPGLYIVVINNRSYKVLIK